jgi:tetratricopeptide (TPR) repeat protein
MTIPASLTFHPRSICWQFMLACLLLLGCHKPEAVAQSQSLAELQRAYAMRYLEPEPHMALAKYYFDHGDRIEAFFITEAARRGRFEEKIFNPAFYRAFDGFDNSRGSEARLLAEYARNPNSIETIHGLADIYISRDDWFNAKRYLLFGIKKKPEEYRFTGGLAMVLDREGKHQEAVQLTQDYVRKFPNTADSYAMKAEPLIRTKPLEARLILTEALKLFPTDGQLLFDLGMVYQGEDNQKAEEAFVKAAELSPKSELVQTWVGRFFFKVKPDNRRALEYYLNAYFLSPDAYETEYVESRIRKIVGQLASEEFAEQTRAGVPLINMLADSNPRVVSYALNQMSENWLPAYVSPVVQVMGHASAGLRWEATQILKTRVDNSFDAQLKALLKGDDPRKRGLAAYIAVYRWKGDSFGILKNLLTEESQLVRFDAISALFMEGGPAGRKVALAHAAHEPNATLKKLITAPNPAENR